MFGLATVKLVVAGPIQAALYMAEQTVMALSWQDRLFCSTNAFIFFLNFILLCVTLKSSMAKP